MSENIDSIKVFDCTIDKERFIVAAWNEKNVLEFMKEISVQSWYDTFIIINEVALKAQKYQL